MKITTAAEMSAIDRATSSDHGVDSLTLMENAGAAVADFAREHWPLANRITVVCGRVNNGGDGRDFAGLLGRAGIIVGGDGVEVLDLRGHVVVSHIGRAEILFVQCEYAGL